MGIFGTIPYNHCQCYLLYQQDRRSLTVVSSHSFSDIVIQDIKIITDNVRYRREVYYSPSTHKTYLAELPADVAGKGEYGVGIRSLIPLLKSECHLSERSILGFLQNFGIEISSATISNLWTKGYTDFHQEKAAIFEAGLSSTCYQQHRGQVLHSAFYNISMIMQDLFVLFTS